MTIRSRKRTVVAKAEAAPEPSSGTPDDEAEVAAIRKRIVRRGAEFCVLSEDGSRSFGCYGTQAEAAERLGQIERFKLAKGTLFPEVLTAEVVAAAEPLPEGVSLLPSSLEGDVPPRYRYWTAKTAEERVEVRRALVESGIFTPETVRVVDGELRRVIREEVLYLAKVDAGAEEPLEVAPENAVAAARVIGDPDLTCIDADVVDALAPEAIPGLLGAHAPWLCVVADGSDRAEAVRAVAKSTFRIATRPGVAFCTSAAIHPSPLVVEEVAKRFSVELVSVGKAGDEETPAECYVLGVVLEPDPVIDGKAGDKQGDTYSAEEVRKTAHRFMRDFQNLGLMHKKLINGAAKVVESWVSPVAFQLGDRVIKEGSWLLGIVITDAEIAKAVRAGKLTAFSIGGDAYRRPVAAPAPAPTLAVA